jgi:hypothetical protein
MESLIDLQKIVVARGSRWIMERVYIEGRNEQPIVEGFDQETEALERMGKLIEKAVGKTFTERELKQMVRESGFYGSVVKVKWEPVDVCRGFQV